MRLTLKTGLSGFSLLVVFCLLSCGPIPINIHVQVINLSDVKIGTSFDFDLDGIMDEYVYPIPPKEYLSLDTEKPEKNLRDVKVWFVSEHGYHQPTFRVDMSQDRNGTFTFQGEKGTYSIETSFPPANSSPTGSGNCSDLSSVNSCIASCQNQGFPSNQGGLTCKAACIYACSCQHSTCSQNKANSRSFNYPCNVAC